MPLRSEHIFSLNGSELLKCVEMFSPQTPTDDAHDEHLIFPLWIECQHTSTIGGWEAMIMDMKRKKEASTMGVWLVLNGLFTQRSHVSPTIFADMRRKCASKSFKVCVIDRLDLDCLKWQHDASTCLQRFTFIDDVRKIAFFITTKARLKPQSQVTSRHVKSRVGISLIIHVSIHWFSMVNDRKIVSLSDGGDRKSENQSWEFHTWWIFL